jgi:cobalt-zinc-cadmium efflux system membrane fusion protein
VTDRFALALAALALGALLACSQAEPTGHGGEHAEAFERGPHGGRWLAEGDFAVELAISEAGASPELRAFVYRDGEPTDPAGVSLEVALRRLGGRVERIVFAPSGDHLRSEREVEEPHSFDVEVVAREGGREHRFAYASYENRVALDPAQIESAGIEVAAAGPATIHERVLLNGRIAPDEDTLVHVMPRFPGVVRSVHKRLGDAVAPGDLLVVIESNESLHPYELRARRAGTVIDKNVAPGEFVSNERELLTIADLSKVWADLDVYRPDFGRLRPGQPVRVDAGDGGAPADTTLSYLSPVGSLNTQTLLARAVLPNPDGSWRPGLFVTGSVEVATVEAPVAVLETAVQRMRDRDVVFRAEDGVFEAQPVELGRRDGLHVEIVSGLAPGQRYAAGGSFVLKAEVGKAGAGHDH